MCSKGLSIIKTVIEILHFLFLDKAEKMTEISSKTVTLNILDNFWANKRRGKDNQVPGIQRKVG